MNIKTNNQWRDLVYRYDVPETVLQEEYAHLDENEYTDGFFKYKGCWYHLTDFMCSDNPVFINWDGYLSDTFFSGVLIKLSSDCEQIKIASFYS